MNFQPMNEDEAQKARNPFEPGDTNFKVIESVPKKSKKGNDMIQLLLHCTDKDGNKANVYDYLLTTNLFLWKVRHFCRATGLMKEYEKGELLPEMLIDKIGKCKTKLKKQEKYADKFVVEDYIESEFNDDIPF